MCIVSEVQGVRGLWYRVAMLEDGKWEEISGPFGSRDSARVARDIAPSCILEEPEERYWKDHISINVVQGQGGWHCLVHVGHRRWAQVSGPLPHREAARNYQRYLESHWLTERRL
jgi:hypothetical protein